MSLIIFECLKCGTCCKNLLEELDGIVGGLLLTADETKHFPYEMISPKMAIGVEKPEKVIRYQLNVNDCPHIDEANNCRIYENRPLVCRAFPYDEEGFALKCKVFSHVKEGEFYTTEYSAAEIDASSKLSRYFRNQEEKYRKKGSKKWEYDLRTKKWLFLMKPQP